MQAGKYKYQIKIYNKTKKRDEFGAETDSYSLIRTTMAAVSWKSGNRVADHEIILDNTLQIVVRQYCEINDSTHVELQGKMYRIVNYHDDYKYHDKIVTIEVLNK